MALLDSKRSSVKSSSHEPPMKSKTDPAGPDPTSATPPPRLDGAHPPNGLIRERAYQIYQLRLTGQAPGDATSDWLTAERELHEIAAKEKAAASRAVQTPRRFS